MAWSSSPYRAPRPRPSWCTSAVVSYTITGIPDGTYEAYVVSGQDWHGVAGVFARHCHYAQPTGTLSLTSNRSSYTDAWMDADTSNTPFFADGVDPDPVPR